MATVTTIANLDDISATCGVSSDAALILALDGNFYGTVENLGVSNGGGIFSVTPSGTLTPLYSFTGSPDGSHPVGPLVQANDGQFYGTTTIGGDGNPGQGTVFKMDSGTFAVTVLHAFTSAGIQPEGKNPQSGLIQALDGNLYGSCTRAGANGDFGTLWSITTAGVFTVLQSFSGTDGKLPNGKLIQAPDGNFYGVTQRGGASNNGTVFKLDGSSFSFTTLYEFTGLDDGFEPRGALTLGPDGNLYGCTSGGGAGPTSAGTLFRITFPGLALSTLTTFPDTCDGNGDLILVGNDFYGTSDTGGASFFFGSVFRIDPQYNIDIFGFFADTTQNSGRTPNGPLVIGADNLFYGTTQRGGTVGNGVVFSFDPSGPVLLLGG